MDKIKLDTLPDTDLVTIPEGMKRPTSIDETVQICNHIFITNQDTESEDVDIWAYLREDYEDEGDGNEMPFNVAGLVPDEYKDLSKWLEHVYEEQYRLGKGFTIEDPHVEAMFQQLQIILDKEKDRTNVNNVGLYAPSYIDALVTAGSSESTVDNRFLGRGHFAEEKPFSAILLGCSSITSANDFNKIVTRMNPEADALIIDKDPIAIALSKSAGVEAINGDVLSLGKSLPKADLVATNFLISSMPESERMDAYKQLFTEWKNKIYPKTGRLVIVEQMTEKEKKQIFQIAFKNGYMRPKEHISRTDRYENGTALRYSSSKSVGEELEGLPEQLDKDAVYLGKYYSNEVDTVVVDGVGALVFEVK